MSCNTVFQLVSKCILIGESFRKTEVFLLINSKNKGSFIERADQLSASLDI